MTVDDVHNFMIKGNVIAKNCDSLRYFCVYWTNAAETTKATKRHRWTADLLEDYENASPEIKELIVAKYGEPHYEDV